MRNDLGKIIRELHECIKSLGQYILRNSWSKVTQQFMLQMLANISEGVEAFSKSSISRDILVNIRTLTEIIIRLIIIAQLLNR